MHRYNLPIIAGERRHFQDVFHVLTEWRRRASASLRHRWGVSVKLFSRFFSKSPPPPPTVEERIARLNAGSLDLIVDTALGADDHQVRMAAIRSLPDGEPLRKLAGLPGLAGADDLPAVLQQTAQARLAQLIDEGSIEFTGFCAAAGNRSAIFAVAALCRDDGRLHQALAAVDDPNQLAQLVVESPSSRLRQLAAQAIEDPEQLKGLLKQVRSKDKNVYRILKHKCDALNAADRKAAEIQSEFNALCTSLERHSHRTYDALYPPAFEHLRARWRAMTTEPEASIKLRAEQAIERCGQVIAEHLRDVELQAARAAADRAAHEARERARQEAEMAASAQSEAEAKLRKEAAVLREAEDAERAQKREAEEQVFRQIGGLIRKANAALGDGNTQRAAGLRRAIEEKLPPAPDLPPYLVRHLQQLDDKLNELKQWKDYAVAPKRAELIEEMEALIGSTEEPKILAERIKSLQQDWRTIGKGIVSDTSADWERFHRASQAAYQPCREYFDAQAKLRQENLEKRRVLLGRLTAFEAVQNTEDPDWRLLGSVMREAPQEWRQYFPVDREENRPLQGAFDESMGRLQARLDAWHERNVGDKQSLIKRARHLLTQEDGREAIEAVKRLQLQWKEVAPVPRDQEQSLWSEFREVCDAVYQKRQQAYAEYTAGLEAAKLKAVGLCEEAERIAALSGPALLAEGTKLADLRAAFDALDEMPRAEARGLQDRFERALDRCETQIAQQHVRDVEQSFTNLFAADGHVRAYGWGVARGAEPSEREALKQSAESFIAGVQYWPKGGLQSVKDALANADCASDADGAARERAFRILCIRCEIRCEMSTPPEDEALRREYQVQRLMQGMGQGSHTDEGDWDAIALEWIRMGTVSQAAYEGLQSRFMRCWIKRPLRSPERSTFEPNDAGDRRRGDDNRAGQRRHGRDGSTFAAGGRNRRFEGEAGGAPR
jgi:hypothetical protein